MRASTTRWVAVLTALASALGLAQAPPPANPLALSVPRLSIGSQGFLEVHGLIQVWFLASMDDNEPYARLGAARNAFRIRRAELKLSGDVLPSVSFALMIDPAKVLEFGSKTFTVASPDPLATPSAQTEQVPGVLQPTSKVSLLQDAVITFKLVPYANISVGQARTPLTAEGSAPASRLLFVERSEIGRIIGDQRDLGVWVSYRFTHFGYHLGLYNGMPGGNALELDSNKDLVARLEAAPLDGLVIGAAVQRTLAGDGKGVLTVAGGDLKYVGHGVTLAAEVYWKQSTDRTAAALQTRALGGYGALAYLVDLKGLGLQPALRFDWFSPNLAINEAQYWRLTGGINLLIGGPETRLQLNFTHTQASAPPANDDLVLLSAQTAF